MRRFLALSIRLLERGFAQVQPDVCIFSKEDKDGNLTDCLVAHGDDLLFCGTPGFRREATAAIQTFRTGEVDPLTRESPIIFTGIMIEMEPPTTLLLPHQMYAGELPVMDIAEYIYRVTELRRRQC